MENLKISIITATFNSGQTLRDTLESILGQTYNNYEVIVQDGCSTDNTPAIILEYIPRFEGRLKWKSEPDKGLYDAMNKGIARADGDVIGILNSDDFFTSNDILDVICREITGVDAVYGNIHYVNPSNLCKPVRLYSSKRFNRQKMKMGFMPAHPSFYCRHTIYKRYGLFDLNFKVAADFEQLLRLIYVNNIATKYVERDFVTMRTGGASTSGIESHCRILRDHLLAYKKNNVKSNILYESLRYTSKLFEILSFRITRHTKHLRHRSIAATDESC